MKLKWEFSQLNSPLARARGLGTAHGGLHHWKMQRLTAIANIPLFLWGLWSVMTLVAATGADFSSVQAFFVQPMNAVLMCLFLISVLLHVKLGIQTVVEDYVHSVGLKLLCLFLLSIVTLSLGVVSLFSVIKIALF